MPDDVNQPLVDARGLGRTFQPRTGPVAAVAGLDFALNAGEVLGFLLSLIHI